ncbi:MAG: leucine-rich repeat protein [[Eubacterium] siraeum]|nr:leucine-rich repeat protein [[Eubacterium] siraeum]
MDFSSLREQYINQEIVQQNIASFEGDRWIIVELEGDTLYDKYARSTRYNDFSTYSLSAEGQKAQANIKAEHTSFLKAVERHGIDYQIKYTYTTIANALAMKVNADGYNAIRKMSGVVDAYYVDYYGVPEITASSNVVSNNANVYTTGIYNTEGITEKGEGMVVAILDTGLDHTHAAFQDMPDEKTVKFSKDYIQNIVNNGSSQAQLVSPYNKLMAKGTADDFYYNEKVPFAYDYADDDANVYPAYSNHGTHVAGIVAGKSDYVVGTNSDGSDETFLGVAPEAQLMICKVFTDDFESEALGGANTMSILAALNDCVVLGVDVINMSLGTSAGFSQERGDSAQTQFLNAVYDNIENLGISLVVAASNDYSSGFGGGNGTNLASNPDSGTVGSPSTYSAALSVASINGRLSSYIAAKANVSADENSDENPIAFITNSSNEFGQQYDFVELLYDIASTVRGEDARGTTLKFKYVPIKGTGKSTDYTSVASQFVRTNNMKYEDDGQGGEIEVPDEEANERGYATLRNQDYDGVIAFVQRGSTTFNEKVQAAMAAGAQACVIYNNVAGTIRMSLGDIDNPIPTCSITMDAGKLFIDAQKALGTVYGELYVNSEYLAGPFMSDFSSWGPTPSLELKPEITAHGGEIISAVPGGYDKLSGTSMAAPNMSGAVALLRQNLKNKYQNLQGKELNTFVNQMLMSTATIARNEEGNPYSPRKQGAGLAGIADAINSEGYITVNGKDRTKIELGDDKNKTGVYTLEFVMHNLKASPQTYQPVTYVMTETMSSDGKTVAEKSYMLTDMCDIKYYIGGSSTPHSGNVTVPADGTLAVKVVITLDNDARDYLDYNFINGMYVEGFVSMKAAGDTEVTIGLPYLAFYGDWTQAPLFDYDVYEIAENEQEEEDELRRIKSTAATTSVLGKYYDEKYILQLGSYVYDQADDDVKVYPSREKIAISTFDDPSNRTIYELYMVYAGLLRGASEMDVVITDDATGETIYVDKLYNVSKSYANGGSNVGSRIAIELRPDEWGLKNNSTYSVKVTGKLDYAGGENPERNSFEFPFTVDYEAPELLGYKIRYMPWDDHGVTKYKIYMDVEVRDNQFVSSVIPCYRLERPTGEYDELGNPVTELYSTGLTEYPIAVIGQKGETSTVSFEITDIYDEYVKTGKLYLQIEDYAMNANNYQILLGQDEGEDAYNDPVSIAFETDSKLVQMGQENTDSLGTKYYTYTLVTSKNSLYTLKPVSDPANASLKALTWEVSNSNSGVKANGNEIWVGDGTTTRTTLTLKNNAASKDSQRTYAIISVSIRGSQVGKAPTLQSIQLNAALNGDGHATSLNPEGSSTPELELNPEQSVKLTFNWTPWYCEKPAVEWKTSNPRVATVDEDGTITANERGSATITVTSVDRRSVSRSVKVVVGRQYNIINYTLYDWYGSGDVVIPSDLNIMYIDEYCFKGREDITSVTLPTSLTELVENAFLGCRNLQEVVIPGQCTSIKGMAFAGCTSLEKVTLGLFVNSDREEIGDEFKGTITLGRYAFMNCSKLTTIENETRITSIYEGAFEGCSSLERIDLTNLRVVGTGAFKDCTALTEVETSNHTALGRDMFKGCTSLETFDFYGGSVPARMFSGCEKLTTIVFHNPITSIGLNAFGESEEYGLVYDEEDQSYKLDVVKTFAATPLANITLPSDSNVVIDADAFKNCVNLETVTLSSGTKILFERNTPFLGCTNFNSFVSNGSSYTVTDGVLYEGNTLVAVPFAKTTITIPNNVTAIADGALAGVNVQTVTLTNVNAIGKYAFADNTTITTVVLPSGLTEIPEGLFDGCLNLTSVTAADDFALVIKIGDYAFRDCQKLSSFTAQNVEEVGAGAFRNSAIEALPSNKLSIIGESAFEGTKLTSVDLGDVNIKEIGEYAFASIDTLTTVALGPIESMGISVFEACPEITSAEFKGGTTAIGAYAFAVEKADSTAFSVTLPASVKTIGSYAFFNRGGIVIDLASVERIGSYAFAYNDAESENYVSGIQTADLSNAKEIGEVAFAYSRLTSVNLPKAEFIGTNAFFGSEYLSSVTLGALKQIEAYAFAGTALTEITLPASFNSRTYKYNWTTVDEKGNPQLNKSRSELSYTPSAFGGISTLTAIHVAAGNEAFFDEDGVLYSRVKNGYVLEQYPVAKTNEDKTYTVIDGTVIIGDRAFEDVSGLDKVILPYTLTTIGSYAFFGASIKDYTFNGVEAPTLLSQNLSEEDLDLLWANFQLSIPYQVAYNYLYLDLYFDRSEYGGTNFYANFTDYAALIDLPSSFKKPLTVFVGIAAINFSELITVTDFGLTMTVPLNGRGYDGIWNTFFSTVNKTATNMPDNTSHKAMEAIEALNAYNKDDIKNMSYDEVKSDSELGKLAAAARAAYNNIVLPDQIELMAEYLNTLMSYESALRSAKASLGYPVRIRELKVSSLPDKIRYNVGEKFDTKGMVITVIYEDGSEVALKDDNYTITPSIIKADTEYVRIEYRDSTINQVVYRDIYINVNSDSGDSNDGEKGASKLGGGAIAGIVVGVLLGVAAIAGAVVAVLLIKKKKTATADKAEAPVEKFDAEKKAAEIPDNAEQAEDDAISAEASDSGDKPAEQTEDNGETPDSDAEHAENGAESSDEKVEYKPEFAEEAPACEAEQDKGEASVEEHTDKEAESLDYNDQATHDEEI